MKMNNVKQKKISIKILEKKQIKIILIIVIRIDMQCKISQIKKKTSQQKNKIVQNKETISKKK